MPKFTLRTLLTIVTVLAIFFGITYPAVLQVREAAKRTTCMNTMRNIVIAMHNYESAFGHLPVGIESNPDGTLRRSWRTHICPMFMESAPQYYDPNTSWDSPANAKLYDGTPVATTDKGGGNPRMVVLDPCSHWLWRCPSDSKIRVNYAVVVGETTAFPIDRSVSFDQITDGLQNTILLVETLSGSSKWTQPLDIRFDDMQFSIENTENGELSSRHPNGVNVTFADGRTFFLQSTISPDDLKALFTIAGNESVTRQQLLDRGILHGSSR